MWYMNIKKIYSINPAIKNMNILYKNIAFFFFFFLIEKKYIINFYFYL
jgi:hypothetical protein